MNAHVTLRNLKLAANHWQSAWSRAITGRDKYIWVVGHERSYRWQPCQAATTHTLGGWSCARVSRSNAGQPACADSCSAHARPADCHDNPLCGRRRRPKRRSTLLKPSRRRCPCEPRRKACWSSPGLRARGAGGHQRPCRRPRGSWCETVREFTQPNARRRVSRGQCGGGVTHVHFGKDCWRCGRARLRFDSRDAASWGSQQRDISSRCLAGGVGGLCFIRSSTLPLRNRGTAGPCWATWERAIRNNSATGSSKRRGRVRLRN